MTPKDRRKVWVEGEDAQERHQDLAEDHQERGHGTDRVVIDIHGSKCEQDEQGSWVERSD